MLAIVLPLGQREEVEELGEQIQALLLAGFLPQVHHQVAGDDYNDGHKNCQAQNHEQCHVLENGITPLKLVSSTPRELAFHCKPP